MNKHFQLNLLNFQFQKLSDLFTCDEIQLLNQKSNQ